MNELPEIPQEIIDAAIKLKLFFAKKGIEKWQLFDVCSRNHAYELENLTKAYHSLDNEFRNFRNKF